MLETNIRIVCPGPELYACVRRAIVEGPDLSIDLLERACGVLRHRHGLAAVVLRDQSKPTLLVATRTTVPKVHIEQEDWVLDVADSGQTVQCIKLSEPEGTLLLPPLMERAVLAKLAGFTDFWTLDSPHIWYEARPFQTADGIAAYRRFELASLLVEGEGVGISADVGTAFFTTSPLSFFFDLSVPPVERERRRSLFTKLTGRQQGQKGTLLYDNTRSRVKCYFEEAPDGITCGSTGRIRVRGKTFESLLAYYRAEFPELPVREDTLAVRVSFSGLQRPQWVAADRIWVRVINEDVPESLSEVDKIEPKHRRKLLEGFWTKLEPKPLGHVAPGFFAGFWRPAPERVMRMEPAALEFGQQRILGAPCSLSIDAYRSFYRERLKYLEEAGCFSLSPAVGRTIYCVYPRTTGEETARQLAGDITARIGKWASRPFASSLFPYDTIAQAIEHLRRAEHPGVVIFVLDDEPAAYHEVSFQLTGWRIKRITENVLRQHFDYLMNGAWDRKRQAITSERGRARWDQFVTMNALDVLQQMDGIPWRFRQAGPYEAVLAIDVGHDRRHFALSLLIARSADKAPTFGIYSDVQVKPDPKHQMINPVMLADAIVRIFQRALRHRFHAIESLLILRDGQLCGEEPQGVESGLTTLAEQEMLARNARVDVVDFHKNSQKAVRLWEVHENDEVGNPLEGTGIRVTQRIAVVASTGAATLHQGTAEPFMLVGDGRCREIADVASAAFAAAQLNWSSPTVAQRLPLPFKRTDDELKARAAQEIRRIR